MPLDGFALVAQVAAELVSSLRDWGSVAQFSLDSASVDQATWGSMLDRAEGDNDFVVLVVTHPADDHAWSRFCVRQADRVLAVAGGAADGTQVSRPDWDLLLCDAATRIRNRRTWIDVVDPRSHHAIRPGHDRDDVARTARRIFGRSIGVVLSGGGARGLAHLGVLEVLSQSGLAIDRVGGTSMGALVGALLATGRAPAEMIELCRSEMTDRHPFRDFRWPRVSLIRARRAAAMLERLFGDAHLDDLAMSCFTVSADLSTAEVVVHRRGPVVESVGASMSLPGLAPPVRLGPRLLVDGGVLNNVPVDVMASTDEGPVVAVDVMTWSPLGSSLRMPSIVETLARATVVGSHHQAAERLGFARVVVAPDVAAVGLLEFARFDSIVEAGRRAARGDGRVRSFRGSECFRRPPIRSTGVTAPARLSTRTLSPDSTTA